MEGKTTSLESIFTTFKDAHGLSPNKLSFAFHFQDHKDKDECWILPANPLLNDLDWKCGSCTAILNASDVHHVTSELGEQVDTLVRVSFNNEVKLWKKKCYWCRASW